MDCAEDLVVSEAHLAHGDGTEAAALVAGEHGDTREEVATELAPLDREKSDLDAAIVEPRNSN